MFLALPVAEAAASNPFQLALFSPVQLVPESDGVRGVRLDILYGCNTEVRGLDLGLVNRTTSGESKVLQLGFVGWAEDNLSGFQWNDINFTRNDFKGFQWGVINYAGNARGFQLGLVNYTENMYGLQIGLINVIKQGKFLPFFPIFNFSF
jgi:hypothetical protein